MTLRIGIVGFGRVGRSLFRLGHDVEGLEFAAICDSADADTLTYLLNHGTVEGAFEPQARREGNYLVCPNQRARFIKESEPGHIPWDMLGVDVVMECTGRYRDPNQLREHVRAGCSKVIFSTPPQGGDCPVVVNGINDEAALKPGEVLSCGSSSVHALALMLKILDGAGGMERASVTTVHAYTGDQQLSDNAKIGKRWSRSAASNIIPNRTWAPGVVESIIPGLAGKLDGLALNVPVSAGSNIDLVAKLRNPLTVDEINDAVRQASEKVLRGYVDYTDEPIVSSDVIGSTASVLFDSTATMTGGEGMVKVLGWFDNGWAYAARMLETAKLAHEAGGGA